MSASILEILHNLGLGSLGLLLFTVWSVREYLTTFSFSILIKRNVPFWIWSLTMLVLFSIVLVISPESSGALKTFTGLDLGNEPAAYIITGMGLGRIARDIQKQQKKKVETVKENNINN